MTGATLTAGLALAAGAGLVGDWLRWRRGRRDVERSFRVANTPLGPVPYLDRGPAGGPVVAVAMGGGAGIDAIDALPWLAEAGYRVICSCRPGYYGVPLGLVEGLAGHADLMAQVLTAIGIEGPVHVLGISAGGPSALHFAARHPTRSLTLWSAVTGAYHPNEDAVNSWLGRLVLSPRGQPVLSWLLSRSARLAPRQTAATFLRTESELSPSAIRALARQVTATRSDRDRLLRFVDATTPMTELYPGMMQELRWMAEPWAPSWEAITAPTLAVGSPVDRDVPIAHLDRLATALPHARTLRVDAGGHFVWWGPDGERVIEATLDHLATSSG